MFISIGQAATLLGISITTLRRWEREGFFAPSYRTLGGHRRYALTAIENLFNHNKPSDQIPDSRKALGYARVSSHDQRKDLETQKLKLEKYCEKNFQNFEIISDLGSGLNYKKAGLKKLFRMIFQRQISHLVLNHKDRLLRFGSELIFELCRHFGVQVVILEKQMDQSFEAELAQDVIELMTVFSSRLYGKRSHSNRQKLAA
jgi:predicted site-specific integrase-resolvase